MCAALALEPTVRVASSWRQMSFFSAEALPLLDRNFFDRLEGAIG